VNRVEFLRTATRLRTRERILRVRFIEPIISITSWDTASLDQAAAYVALLHSEAEASIEKLVRDMISHARTCSERFRPHPILINGTVYFQAEVSQRLAGIELCPKRNVLETDHTRLITAWDTFRIEDFFLSKIDKNNGAGVAYVEQLLHPLGIVVSPKRFTKVEGLGVRAAGQLSNPNVTEMTEFVLLRGSAVHAGAAAFTRQLQAENPTSLVQRGTASVAFVEKLASELAKQIW